MFVVGERLLTSSDADIQLLEASKSGDVEVVKVCVVQMIVLSSHAVLLLSVRVACVYVIVTANIFATVYACLRQ